MIKYRGLVIDQLGTLDTRKTASYSTYQEAHEKAEALCKKTMGDRGRIKVEEFEHGGLREGAGRKQTGRKRFFLYLTDDEHSKVKEFIESLRG